ncbi:MAG: putative Xaa-Pro aminopeptidase [Candidatus Saccharibacteria bacterium]|nr:putative Xaa-Pro aminopeptidase [Candidatus Saccharibacteria bacterium]
MTPDFFQRNRSNLVENLDKGIIVLSAYSQMQRGNDAAFGFEQEANFWYLTGINAPDWWVIIDGSKSWLVAPEVDAVHQVFNGSLAGNDAKEISGVDEVISRDDARDMLQHIARTSSVVYTLSSDPHAKYYDFVVNPAGKDMQQYLKKNFTDVRDCRIDLAKIRAIKQSIEIDAIKQAIKLTNDAFSAIKPKLSELKYEYQVEAEFTYRFRNAGATGHAYDPIVASSSNAVTLHYNTNNERLKNHSLLLIDIGARVDGYAADITRTYAVGVPTKRQQDVHTAVARAQRDIIALLRPGLSVSDYQASVDTIMQDALIKLGLLKSRDDQVTYRKYFPHAISHGLGIDVHDSLGAPSEFLPGMVLTVEPGIYIPEEGIGVRIEDDILITTIGHQNLSASLSTSL